MASRRRGSSSDGGDEGQPDLFSLDPSATTMHALDGRRWPSGERFPFNRAGARVRDQVRPDLLSSAHPLVVAGYASMAALVDLVADWATHERGHTPGGSETAGSSASDAAGGGLVRLLLGAEPFPTLRRSFASSQAAFTEEVRTYWEDRGISLRLSAKVLTAIQLIDEGRFTTRYVHGHTSLHAKIYAGAGAATLGSSNFTDAGLLSQLEANARFTLGQEPDRFHELWTIAEHLWDIGQPFDAELRILLEDLLRVVSWQEALAYACADLLEGQWARRYLDDAGHGGGALWPSQRAGIAQALWITENVGSALVADATGSGKTRMGAHLVRAVRDRMWSTGRARRDLAVVVCPPAVEHTWRREAITAGINVLTISHGLLSRGGGEVPRMEEDAVRGSQILAVDESHNFLNRDSNRTRQLRDSQPDHVLLFTATPINRGPSDLLQLVGLLGADNFEDETLEVLRRLERRRGTDQVLSTAEVDLLRREIQRFTVRRTKTLLNELVDREPDAYADPLTGRVCRYPRHDARTYETGEGPDDEAVADEIRAIIADLVGIAQLERAIAVPIGLRAEYTDERWLGFRLASVRGLAAHHVLGAMRSSRAALIEHLAGTAAASDRFGLTKFKPTGTGDVIAKLRSLGADGPPAVSLSCDVPTWLIDPEEWAARCDADRERYEQMLALAERLTAARERAKADLLLRLAEQHERILAFDRHPITLEQLRVVIGGSTTHAKRVIVATGSTPNERRQVEAAFARSSTERAIALCSDAMNEGLNLQGASAIVHLDLPTTLRVAEQRIGRVDRMDSPYDTIEAWWPCDGRSFATRANELLAQRAAESAQLLGSNLPVPDLRARTDRAADELLGDVVDVQERIAEAEAPGAETWDGIRDALDPVRQLVTGPAPLVPADVYEMARTAEVRAGARLSVVAASTPWAFLAVAAGAHGAPRWLLLHASSVGTAGRLTGTSDLAEVSHGLRSLLRDDPPSHALDDSALEFLHRALDAATTIEFQLLPRRSQRALEQLVRITHRWATAARKAGKEAEAQRWLALRELGALRRRAHDDIGPDPQLVAEQWTSLIRPVLDGYRRKHRHQPFVVLRDLDETLARSSLDLDAVERAFAALPRLAPLAERVSSCILGVLRPPPTHEAGSAAAQRHGSC